MSNQLLINTSKVESVGLGIETFGKKSLTTLIISLYVLSKHLREVLLLSGLGFTSQCKHQPTCGENLIIQIKNKGVRRGSIIAFRQLAGCY